MSDAGLPPPPDGDRPLGPDASMEEIQARLAHLSRSEAQSPDPEPSLASWIPQPAGESTATPDQALPAAPAKRRGRLPALLGGGGAVLVGIGVVVAKLGVKLFAVSVAAGALAGAFGGRYDQLPSDQRKAYEQRYDAVIGSSLDGLSDADRSARLDQLVSSGAGRLDDASLVLWAHLDTKAHTATSTETCAAVARGWFATGADKAAVSEAVSKAYESLPNEDFSRVIDLNLKSMEADKAKAPLRAVADSDINPVLSELFAAMSSAENTTIDDMAAGKPATDDAACGALRGIETAAETLPPGEFTTWAVWLATP